MAAQVTDHYTSDNLEARIVQGLKNAGKDLSGLTLKDLSVIDQLHTGGHLATLSLAKAAGLASGMTVLDAGCGIGGTTRLLAEQFGCKVIGIDLMEIFVSAAQTLTAATGLTESTRFIQGNVCSMPFDDGEFDCVWSQHTLMNIQDKEAVFKEFFRVLKPGGLLVLHEVFKGSDIPLQLPVPWADTHAISFLEPWDTALKRLTGMGMSCQASNDLTGQARTWWQKVKEAALKSGDKPRPLGPHIVFGENGKHFGSTMSANLDNQCIQVMEAVFTRPS